ncbi:thyroid transcription factor 1-associated protein 26-like [Mercenaria mercenaria]|uniref:thyroid transcription factor 1-associated protein 26-like n=1 Tax=Mercenaria mercenaria TaxID=6596 RepID=UPI00234E80C7|nr:thyroid transcription factor 1-associated protein 26-like [Mercenaria mercenaria]
MDRKHLSGKGKGNLKGQRAQKQNEKYKKFIGNRSEGQGFADKRKRKIQYEYMKMMKKEKLKEKLQQATAARQSKLNTSSKNQNVGKTIHLEERRGIGYTVGHLSKPGPGNRGSAGSPSKEPGTRKKKPDKNDIEQQDSRPNPEKKFKGNPKERHQNMFRKGGKVGMEGTTRFSKAAGEYQQRKEKKLEKQQEYLKSRERREEAMGDYQKRKQETFKKICKKTHKGQPIMKNQIEYLLQKIERQVNNR